MPLRSAEQYIESLRDGRIVYFRGRRVADVTTHPVIGVAVDHAAIDYRLADDQHHSELCVVSDGGQRIFALLPHSAHRGRPAAAQRAHRAGDRRRGDARRAHQGDRHRRAVRPAAGQPRRRRQARHRIRPARARLLRDCRDNDLAMAVAQTDVKGDRSLGPAKQPIRTSTSTSSSAGRTASWSAAPRPTPR